MFAIVKKDEQVVKKADFGFLVEEFVMDCLRLPPRNIDPEWINKRLREWWPMLEEYYQRHIMTDIEVAITLDEEPRYNRAAMDPLRKFMWQQIVKDLRPPKHPFTVDYHCHKCKAKDVKLWRGVHGSADKDGNELLCATCLAPDVKVSDNGHWEDPSFGSTDQVKGWLPAIPVDNTYWGYSSVPSQDVEWWQAIPTYPKK